MPEDPNPKPRPHPFRFASGEAGSSPVRAVCSIGYAELAVTTNYSFLRGASHPDEMVEMAGTFGHRFAAIADRNTLAGIVRAHVAAKEAGIPIAIGCRLVFTDPDGLELLVFPSSRAAYAHLCQLLTTGKRRAPKGECHLRWNDLLAHQSGLLAVALPPSALCEAFTQQLRELRAVFDDDRLSLAATRSYGPDDSARMLALASLAKLTRTPLVAVNDAHYHVSNRRPLQDVLTCIRHGCTIHEAGFRLQANAERHLKPPDEMARLFAEYPEAIARTNEVAQRAAAFSLDELKYEYPDEPIPRGISAIEHLRNLCDQGARLRYPNGIPEKLRASLDHETALIAELRYEPYFLTCHDIVRFARSKGILCQGRGAAANSAVCFCLGITEVDPAKNQLLFERFISAARKEPLDIDIDFEHERREEVIQYIYQRYGRDRAALTAEVISYRGRSAVRDVGKAMGLSLDCVDTLARNLDLWGETPSAQRVKEAGINPDDATIRMVMALTAQLQGFPRHLSQHVGGFVMTRSPLCELVPIENAAMEDRTVIEWDKDDIDAMGMLKVDVLGLGMLTCIRKAFDLVARSGGEALSIARIMDHHAEDPATYAMIQRADTIGVFQIESRAQMSMLPRLKPAEFYDLVIEVAIVRPGPIQGKMVHPYLRRRRGEEQFDYPGPEIRQVLERTLGVPLFQEQAMQLAIVAGGFTPEEADKLRRAMAAWKRKGDLIFRFGQKLIEGMLARGYPAEFAERCFEQIKGFSEYGFPESHAASFAILVYVSCWLKCHHPAAFAAALINSQPMGFYQPAQIVRDAKEHGVEVRPIDVNHSAWDCTLEECPSGLAIRLGMRLAKGLPQIDADRVSAIVRQRGRFDSVLALWRQSRASARAMRCLARADAFGSLGIDRQAALWAVRTLRDDELPLFDAVGEDAIVESSGATTLPAIPAPERTLHDYAFTGLSLRDHPMAFLRKRLDRKRVVPAARLRNEADCPSGRMVRVAGVVLVRQRPATASGVVFITLEDETGIANLVVWTDTYERFRRTIRLSHSLLVEGKVEREGEVVHVHARRFRGLDEYLPALESVSRDFH